MMYSSVRSRMFRTSVLILALSVFISAEDLFGPKYKPTKGAIWPKPKEQVTKDEYYKFNPKYFTNITVTGQSCEILVNALERYAFVVRSADRTARYLAKKSSRRRRSIKELGSLKVVSHKGDNLKGDNLKGDNLKGDSPNDVNYKGYLEQLEVLLTAPCETSPYFGMDESYNLTVSTVSQLTSASLWGILRGLESWVQLFHISDDEPDMRINKTSIHDAPRYPHRGLLIDTSRHYISLAKIQNTLDAMAMNKMNVLHWHIVDDQSFPYQSDKFPELSRRGAFHRSMVYTKQDMQMIIDYARDRGIRVLPEFDVPGHTRSWGESHPEILTSCYSHNRVSGLGPMNPIHNSTYQLLQDLFKEIQDLFPDKYFHVGGDEVDLHCWQSNPELIEYMRAHNMPTAKQLHALFMSRVIPMLAPRSSPIVWQEVFDEAVPLPEDSLVQVWKDDNLAPILNAGYKVIYSTAWYLDHMKGGGDWEKYYQADPRDRYENPSRGSWRRRYSPELSHNVVGGEACMWGEVVDDRNFISRIWPRASAVAEKLWSPTQSSLWGSIPRDVYCRLEEHYCRMNRRGVPAQPPNGPGLCLGAP